jgi:hypothetical protein
MKKEKKSNKKASKFEDINFGIASDPLIEFALAFAALIHDVDHPGVSNAQLVKEGHYLAKKYDNHCVAEQNSVDCAWNLLMKPAYKNLRSCIYSSQEEFERFRLLVVNLVLATDIWDTDLSNRRSRLWEKAFKKAGPSAVTDMRARNRKATIVIEHLIQASDVAHTMQHWNVYLKWNKRLFQEMYASYKAGRGQENPADIWFQGELAFFDDFVIPLANKLLDCRVFGDYAEEFLNYAKANRRDWQLKGRDVILGYVSEYNANGKRILPSLANTAATSISILDSSISSLPWITSSTNASSKQSSISSIKQRYMRNLSES